MSTVSKPRVPEGLRDMMKDLTKEILKEKPTDIYDFAENYFQSRLPEKENYVVKNFEKSSGKYDFSYIQNPQRYQVPVALVYSIIPESLTNLIKDFIKAVLREQPQNLCDFAVEYFRHLKAATTTTNSQTLTKEINYSTYENYFINKERFLFTPYVKCTCGRTLGEAFTSSYQLENLKSIHKLHSSDSVFQSNLLDFDNTKNYVKKLSENDSNYSEKYINSIYIIQRCFRRYLKRKNATTNKQEDKESVTEKPINEEKLLVPQLQLNQNETENNSEDVSYTSASTAILSATESGRETSEPSTTDSILTKTIIEGVQVDNDDKNISDDFKKFDEKQENNEINSDDNKDDSIISHYPTEEIKSNTMESKNFEQSSDIQNNETNNNIDKDNLEKISKIILAQNVDLIKDCNQEMLEENPEKKENETETFNKPALRENDTITKESIPTITKEVENNINKDYINLNNNIINENTTNDLDQNDNSTQEVVEHYQKIKLIPDLSQKKSENISDNTETEKYSVQSELTETDLKKDLNENINNISPELYEVSQNDTVLNDGCTKDETEHGIKDLDQQELQHFSEDFESKLDNTQAEDVMRDTNSQLNKQTNELIKNGNSDSLNTEFKEIESNTELIPQTDKENVIDTIEKNLNDESNKDIIETRQENTTMKTQFSNTDDKVEDAKNVKIFENQITKETEIDVTDKSTDEIIDENQEKIISTTPSLNTEVKEGKFIPDKVEDAKSSEKFENQITNEIQVKDKTTDELTKQSLDETMVSGFSSKEGKEVENIPEEVTNESELKSQLDHDVDKEKNETNSEFNSTNTDKLIQDNKTPTTESLDAGKNESKNGSEANILKQTKENDEEKSTDYSEIVKTENTELLGESTNKSQIEIHTVNSELIKKISQIDNETSTTSTLNTKGEIIDTFDNSETSHTELKKRLDQEPNNSEIETNKINDQIALSEINFQSDTDVNDLKNISNKFKDEENKEMEMDDNTKSSSDLIEGDKSVNRKNTETDNQQDIDDNVETKDVIVKSNILESELQNKDINKSKKETNSENETLINDVSKSELSRIDSLKTEKLELEKESHDDTINKFEKESDNNEKQKDSQSELKETNINLSDLQTENKGTQDTTDIKYIKNVNESNSKTESNPMEIETKAELNETNINLSDFQKENKDTQDTTDIKSIKNVNESNSKTESNPTEIETKADINESNNNINNTDNVIQQTSNDSSKIDSVDTESMEKLEKSLDKGSVETKQTEIMKKLGTIDEKTFKENKSVEIDVDNKLIKESNQSDSSLDNNIAMKLPSADEENNHKTSEFELNLKEDASEELNDEFLASKSNEEVDLQNSSKAAVESNEEIDSNLTNVANQITIEDNNILYNNNNTADNNIRPKPLTSTSESNRNITNEIISEDNENNNEMSKSKENLNEESSKDLENEALLLKSNKVAEHISNEAANKDENNELENDLKTISKNGIESSKEIESNQINVARQTTIEDHKILHDNNNAVDGDIRSKSITSTSKSNESNKNNIIFKDEENIKEISKSEQSLKEDSTDLKDEVLHLKSDEEEEHISNDAANKDDNELEKDFQTAFKNGIESNKEVEFNQTNNELQEDLPTISKNETESNEEIDSNQINVAEENNAVDSDIRPKSTTSTSESNKNITNDKISQGEENNSEIPKSQQNLKEDNSKDMKDELLPLKSIKETEHISNDAANKDENNELDKDFETTSKNESNTEIESNQINFVQQTSIEDHQVLHDNNKAADSDVRPKSITKTSKLNENNTNKIISKDKENINEISKPEQSLKDDPIDLKDETLLLKSNEEEEYISNDSANKDGNNELQKDLTNISKNGTKSNEETESTQINVAEKNNAVDSDIRPKSVTSTSESNITTTNDKISEDEEMSKSEQNLMEDSSKDLTDEILHLKSNQETELISNDAAYIINNELKNNTQTSFKNEMESNEELKSNQTNVTEENNNAVDSDIRPKSGTSTSEPNKNIAYDKISKDDEKDNKMSKSEKKLIHNSSLDLKDDVLPLRTYEEAELVSNEATKKDENNKEIESNQINVAGQNSIEDQQFLNDNINAVESDIQSKSATSTSESNEIITNKIISKDEENFDEMSNSQQNIKGNISKDLKDGVLLPTKSNEEAEHISNIATNKDDNELEKDFQTVESDIQSKSATSTSESNEIITNKIISKDEENFDEMSNSQQNIKGNISKDLKDGVLLPTKSNEEAEHISNIATNKDDNELEKDFQTSFKNGIEYNKEEEFNQTNVTEQNAIEDRQFLNDNNNAIDSNIRPKSITSTSESNKKITTKIISEDEEDNNKIAESKQNLKEDSSKNLKDEVLPLKSIDEAEHISNNTANKDEKGSQSTSNSPIESNQSQSKESDIQPKSLFSTSESSENTTTKVIAEDETNLKEDISKDLKDEVLTLKSSEANYISSISESNENITTDVISENEIKLKGDISKDLKNEILTLKSSDEAEYISGDAINKIENNELGKDSQTVLKNAIESNDEITKVAGNPLIEDDQVLDEKNNALESEIQAKSVTLTSESIENSFESNSIATIDTGDDPHDRPNVINENIQMEQNSIKIDDAVNLIKQSNTSDLNLDENSTTDERCKPELNVEMEDSNDIEAHITNETTPKEGNNESEIDSDKEINQKNYVDDKNTIEDHQDLCEDISPKSISNKNVTGDDLLNKESKTQDILDNTSRLLDLKDNENLKTQNNTKDINVYQNKSNEIVTDHVINENERLDDVNEIEENISRTNNTKLFEENKQKTTPISSSPPIDSTNDVTEINKSQAKSNAMNEGLVKEINEDDNDNPQENIMVADKPKLISSNESIDNKHHPINEHLDSVVTKTVDDSQRLENSQIDESARELKNNEEAIIVNEKAGVNPEELTTIEEISKQSTTNDIQSNTGETSKEKIEDENLPKLELDSIGVNSKISILENISKNVDSEITNQSIDKTFILKSKESMVNEQETENLIQNKLDSSENQEVIIKSDANAAKENENTNLISEHTQQQNATEEIITKSYVQDSQAEKSIKEQEPNKSDINIDNERPEDKDYKQDNKKTIQRQHGVVEESNKIDDEISIIENQKRLKREIPTLQSDFIDGDNVVQKQSETSENLNNISIKGLDIEEIHKNDTISNSTEESKVETNKLYVDNEQTKLFKNHELLNENIEDKFRNKFQNSDNSEDLSSSTKTEINNDIETESKNLKEFTLDENKSEKSTPTKHEENVTISKVSDNKTESEKEIHISTETMNIEMDKYLTGNAVLKNEDSVKDNSDGTNKTEKLIDPVEIKDLEYSFKDNVDGTKKEEKLIETVEIKDSESIRQRKDSTDEHANDSDSIQETENKLDVTDENNTTSKENTDIKCTDVQSATPSSHSAIDESKNNEITSNNNEYKGESQLNENIGDNFPTNQIKYEQQSNTLKIPTKKDDNHDDQNVNNDNNIRQNIDEQEILDESTKHSNISNDEISKQRNIVNESDPSFHQTESDDMEIQLDNEDKKKEELSSSGEIIRVDLKSNVRKPQKLIDMDNKSIIINKEIQEKQIHGSSENQNIVDKINENETKDSSINGQDAIQNISTIENQIIKDERNNGDNSKMLTESKEISKDDINSESLINISNHALLSGNTGELTATQLEADSAHDQETTHNIGIQTSETFIGNQNLNTARIRHFNEGLLGSISGQRFAETHLRSFWKEYLMNNSKPLSQYDYREYEPMEPTTSIGSSQQPRKDQTNITSLSEKNDKSDEQTTDCIETEIIKETIIQSESSPITKQDNSVTQTNTNQSKDIERIPRYFYGVPDTKIENNASNIKRKIYKEPTAFTIPIDNTNKKQTLKTIHTMDKPLKKSDTKEVEIQDETILNLASCVEAEPLLDAESPTRLFQDLNQFEYEIHDVDLDITYTIDEIIRFKIENDSQNNFDENDENLNDISEYSVTPEPMLQTIVELSESETPKPTDQIQSIDKYFLANLEDISNVTNSTNSSWTTGSKDDNSFVSDEFLDDKLNSEYTKEIHSMSTSRSHLKQGGIYEFANEDQSQNDQLQKITEAPTPPNYDPFYEDLKESAAKKIQNAFHQYMQKKNIKLVENIRNPVETIDDKSKDNDVVSTLNIENKEILNEDLKNARSNSQLDIQPILEKEIISNESNKVNEIGKSISNQVDKVDDNENGETSTKFIKVDDNLYHSKDDFNNIQSKKLEVQTHFDKDNIENEAHKNDAITSNKEDTECSKKLCTINKENVDYSENIEVLDNTKNKSNDLVVQETDKINNITTSISNEEKNKQSDKNRQNVQKSIYNIENESYLELNVDNIEKLDDDELNNVQSNELDVQQSHKNDNIEEGTNKIDKNISNVSNSEIIENFDENGKYISELIDGNTDNTKILDKALNKIEIEKSEDQPYPKENVISNETSNIHTDTSSFSKTKLENSENFDENNQVSISKQFILNVTQDFIKEEQKNSGFRINKSDVKCTKNNTQEKDTPDIKNVEVLSNVINEDSLNEPRSNITENKSENEPSGNNNTFTYTSDLLMANEQEEVNKTNNKKILNDSEENESTLDEPKSVDKLVTQTLDKTNNLEMEETTSNTEISKFDEQTVDDTNSKVSNKSNNKIQDLDEIKYDNEKSLEMSKVNIKSLESINIDEPNIKVKNGDTLEKVKNVNSNEEIERRELENNNEQKVENYSEDNNESKKMLSIESVNNEITPNKDISNTSELENQSPINNLLKSNQNFEPTAPTEDDIKSVPLSENITATQNLLDQAARKIQNAFRKFYKRKANLEDNTESPKSNWYVGDEPIVPNNSLYKTPSEISFEETEAYVDLTTNPSQYLVDSSSNLEMIDANNLSRTPTAPVSNRSKSSLDLSEDQSDIITKDTLSEVGNAKAGMSRMDSANRGANILNETNSSVDKLPSYSGLIDKFITSERNYSDVVNHRYTITDCKSETKFLTPDVAEITKILADFSDAIPYERLEEPCIKKSVSRYSITDDNKVGNIDTSSSSDIDEAEDSLSTKTVKLHKPEEAITKMQQRRDSTTKISSMEKPKDYSFDEPLVAPIDNLDTDEEGIVVNKLQREETRESSAQSDVDVIIGGVKDSESDFNFLQNIDIDQTFPAKGSLKRVHTIAGEEDAKSLLKNVTIDESIKYIEPPEFEVNSGSLCLDDDTAENIRRKIMAYSLSEADSDCLDKAVNNTESKIQKYDDFNVSTALVENGGSSTETESTIVSAVTKIQAGARGYLTRKRLGKTSIASDGKSINNDDIKKASFGNAAISESLEYLVQEAAAKRIQRVYRQHYRQKFAEVKPKSSENVTTEFDTSMENTLAQKRSLMLQRGDALRNDSTPDEGNSSSNGSGSDNDKLNSRLNANKNSQTSSSSSNERNKIVKRECAQNDKSNSEAKTAATIRANKIEENKMKWLAMRQNSMPVQIDSEVLRVIPKYMRKKIKSAESEKRRHRRRLPMD